jgi:hypothetical protein
LILAKRLSPTPRTPSRWAHREEAVSSRGGLFFVSDVSHSKAAGLWGNQRLCLVPYSASGVSMTPLGCRTDFVPADCQEPGDAPVRLRDHTSERCDAVRTISCWPQPSIIKAHGRAANKSTAAAARDALKQQSRRPCGNRRLYLLARTKQERRHRRWVRMMPVRT